MPRYSGRNHGRKSFSKKKYNIRSSFRSRPKARFSRPTYKRRVSRRRFY